MQLVENTPQQRRREPSYRYVDPVAPVPASDELASAHEPAQEELRVQCKLLLSNLAASVPLATPHISYLANIGVRPVAAYLNANYTQIPLNLTWTQPDIGVRRRMVSERGKAH